MKHKLLIFGVALFLSSAVFFFLWLLSLWLRYSLWPAAGFSLFIFVLCAAVPGYIHRRSTACLARLCRLYAREQILYADVASLMEGRREHTGALAVTRRRVLFDTPATPRGRRWSLDFRFDEISLAKNSRGYFHLGAGGQEHRFKVFRCDVLVAAIQACIDADAQAKIQARRAALEGVRKPAAPAGASLPPAPKAAAPAQTSSLA